MKNDFSFEIVARDANFPLMRAGIIKTPHGEIATPNFIAVGTHAAVKFLAPENLAEIKVQAVLANGYHLLRRATMIDAGGGLAKFMKIDLPTFTDSGGFQVMSLGSGLGKIVSMNQNQNSAEENSDFAQKDKTVISKRCEKSQNPDSDSSIAKSDKSDFSAVAAQPLREQNDTEVSMEKIREKNQISDEKSDKENEKTEKLAHVFDDGVEFRDPYSSRIIKFTPEMSIAAQHKIGADVMMSFDELTNVEDSYNYNVAALERTRKWAERGLREHIRQTNLRVGKKYQALYGCLQGASFRDLREKAARDLAEMSVDGWKFDGFGLGGAFLKENLGEIVSWMTQILPEEKPRHLLGLARPDDIFAGVENGADTFDCVAPTREARHGRIYTLRGNINLRRAEFSADNSPLDENCDCPTCVKNIREILADFYKNSSDNLADFSANSKKFENNSDDFSANSENNSENNSDDFLHDFQAKFDTNFDEKFSRKTLRKMLKNPDEKIRARVFTLLSQHNLRFIIRLMENIRAAIFRGNYAEFKRDFCAKYYK